MKTGFTGWIGSSGTGAEAGFGVGVGFDGAEAGFGVAVGFDGLDTGFGVGVGFDAAVGNVVSYVLQEYY